MINHKFIFFIILLITLNCHAQIQPAPDAKLNYNQVMFEYKEIKGANLYVIQIAEGNLPNAFEHYLVQQQDSATATMVSNLSFGKKYQWRYAAITNTGKTAWLGPYNFEIVEDTTVKKNLTKVTVTQNNIGQNAGGLISIDATHTIIDRAGNIVWYMPGIKWRYNLLPPTKTVNNIQLTALSVTVAPVMFDLRLTSAGTITCLADSDVAERDLNGNVTWRPPNDGKVSGFGGEAYNHDFKRLPNGHYMVLGNELWYKLPADIADSTASRTRFADRHFFNGTEYAKVEFGTVIEYDKQGNVVWSWNSHKYLEYDPLRPKIRNQRIEYPLKAHINAFSTDKKNEFVYIGFRDISRIVKVEKSTGKVVDSWGLRLYLGGAEHPAPLHQQHDANILANGNIAVFNSNDYPGSDSIPAALIISQKPADSGKVTWRFDCQLDSTERKTPRNGGNVDELNNGNLLICSGTSDRIFEVTKNKNVVWQCQLSNVIKNGITYTHRLYRAHYISSLYPCYFVFTTNKDTVSPEIPQFNIRLFNKGSEQDIYYIKLSSSAGNTIWQFTTGNVPPGQSVSYKIDPGIRLSIGDKMELTVTSQTNSDFVRKDNIVVQ